MYSFHPFGASDVAIACADDPASRQQKMLQQRQLALKRQRDLVKTPIAVVAQQHVPLKPNNMQKKPVGWGTLLQTGGSGEKLPLNDSSALVKVVVPPAVTTDEGRMDTQLGAQSPSQVSDQAECESDLPREQQVTQDVALVLEQCWESQSKTSELQSQQEKPRGRRFWKPWGSSKRVTISAEATALTSRIAVLSKPDGGDATVERAAALSVKRSGTPWTACTDAILESSLDSDTSVLRNVSEDAAAGCDFSGDAVINDEDAPVIDTEHDDSADSGIESTVKVWEQQKLSPAEKRNRFGRFKLWGSNKPSPNAAVVSHSVIEEATVDCGDALTHDEDAPVIDSEHDDSADSGIENTVKEWKQHKLSPADKKSRFRIPKLWGSNKLSPNGVVVSHTPVMALEADLD